MAPEWDHDPECRQWIVSGPAAKGLAFLARIDSDLLQCQQRCEMYLREEECADPAPNLLSAFADGAIVAYGRSDQGAGGRLPAAVVEAMSNYWRGEHNWVMMVRKKFVAHSVNQLNQTVTIAEVAANDSISAVFTTNLRVVLPSDSVHRIHAAATELRRVLQVRLKLARDEVTRAVELDPSLIAAKNELQLDLVDAAAIDYLATRGEWSGRFDVPGALEDTIYDAVSLPKDLQE